ncbi:aromatic amino acid lyase [Labrys monachus]|uniref:Histidine ammonia-lyase n=1 Tax=Labrys monachus TaxID=217067 RepID=A0ABU0FL58_9HYPH|nr:aromatic amino acid lyase [Labrys monachus]MDQ0394833.1 histidine ammonia-lyase [Labrys monachus]
MSTARPLVAFGEAPLTLRDVTAIARREADIGLSEAGRDAVVRARAVVDRLVDEAIPAYGITTGVGSQKDFGVSREAIARYNELMITAHATMAPGANASPAVVRAALAIQLSLFARGRSGVRLELVESLLARLQADDLPAARLGSSVGASDIVAMSQLALPLIGRDGVAPGGGGPAPLPGLAAKEAISLLNSNSLMLAQAALALAEVRALLDAATLAGALSMEGFRGNLRSWRREVDEARGQPGQSRSGEALRRALAGSRLWQAGEARFLQDPLSFRCIPQIHGAAEAAWDFAHAIFETELSAACDNPLIDTASGAFISHGNMETTACCLAMDMLRQALAKVIEASGQRIHKIQWPGFTGLPTSLAAEPGAIGGVQFLNLGHLAGANVGAVRQAAHPALLNYSGQLDDGVEDVAGNAPQSVAETVRSLVPAWNVVTIEIACAVWAIHRRGLAAADLGEGVRPLAEGMLALLPIGTEGRRIFDLGPLVELVRATSGSRGEEA